MRNDWYITDDLRSRIIDFLYDVKTDGTGWLYKEATEIINILEKQGYFPSEENHDTK